MSGAQLRFALLAVLPLALVGCTSDEGGDQDKCSSFGFHQGSRAHANCMFGLSFRGEDYELRYLDRLHAREERDYERAVNKRRQEKSG
ncbi:hypothetical protein CQ054_21065 [Ochrobactrum sp. MYb29]|nr:hypothetical protein CWE02_09625 [Brucella pituitosa]PRA80517.1 hypothetical protein CQ054_21065 [Ochrobactrum sp. MYb29]TCQ72946.1 hypothetical protein EDF68_1209 [Ochrobactrum sp. BH3]